MMVILQKKFHRLNCFLEDDTTDDKQVFTDDEIALLTDYLWKRYEQDHTYTAPLAILFPFVTGVRAGELCAMKFSDMIEDGKFIQIKRQRVKKLNQDGEVTCSHHLNPRF